MQCSSPLSVLLGWLLVAGCGDDGGGGIDFGGTEGTGGTDGSGPSTSGTETEGPTDGTESTTGPATDSTATDPSAGSSGAGTDTDGPGTTGDLEPVPCIGLDILFVVDNSTGMADKQTRLTSTANAFVTMAAAGVSSAAGDVNIGVITTDEAQLVVPTAGTYLSGEAWMTTATLDAAELTTALTAGDQGNPNERPLEMMLEALTTQSEPEMPNEGFVREDALLIVVILTDEEDDLEEITQWGSDGDPAGWIEALTAVKTYRRNVVPLSIIPTGGQACSDESNAPRLAEFTNGFPRGVTYDICDLEYATFLTGQVTELDQACNLFVPP